MRNDAKINVFARNYAELDTYIRETGKKRDEVRFVDCVIRLYGMWQGTLVVLPGAHDHRDFVRICDEARRRNLTLDIIEEKEPRRG